MARHIRLLKDWNSPKGFLSFTAGNVVGVRDKMAAELVAAGTAEYVPDEVRTLRYAPSEKMNIECFANDEEKETAPKNAVHKPASITTPSGSK